MTDADALTDSRYVPVVDQPKEENWKAANCLLFGVPMVAAALGWRPDRVDQYVDGMDRALESAYEASPRRVRARRGHLPKSRSGRGRASEPQSRARALRTVHKRTNRDFSAYLRCFGTRPRALLRHVQPDLVASQQIGRSEWVVVAYVSVSSGRRTSQPCFASASSSRARSLATRCSDGGGPEKRTKAACVAR